MLRKAAVAGTFYPSDPGELQNTVKTLLKESEVTEKQSALAVIAPHAGYIYSGALAGKTLQSVSIPDTVVLIGPNHTGLGKPVSVSDSPWEIPNTTVPIDQTFIDLLIKTSDGFSIDNEAHLREHSLEVQLPFLTALNDEVSIVPITVSRLHVDDCLTLGKDLAKVIREYKKDVLIVVSNDMSHMITREEAKKFDKMALDQITALSPRELYNTVFSNRISMCGVIPVTIALEACNQLGAKSSKLVGYTDSGEASGNTDQVVGYAGFVIE